MLISFHASFAEVVASGAKTRTIRRPRRDGYVPVVGERVYLYTGMRTKRARKLGEGIATAVDDVRLEPAEPLRVYVVGRLEPDPDAFARADGFDDARAMAVWFQSVHGLPFAGHLICWRLLPRAEWRKP